MQIIDIAILSVSALVVVLLGASVYLQYRNITFLVGAWLSVRELLNSPADGRQSPLAAILSDVATNVMKENRMSALGQASGEARADLGAEAEVIEAAVRKLSPVGAIAAEKIFGKRWGRTLARNPHYLTAGEKLFSGGGALAWMMGDKQSAGAAEQKSFDFGSLERSLNRGEEN
jgi:hypothetical protein